MDDDKEVTYLDDVLQSIRGKLQEAATFTTTKILPGQRGKLYPTLEEANALLGSVIEVMDRSGMGKKLGFIKTANGIQPVTTAASENKADG